MLVGYSSPPEPPSWQKYLLAITSQQHLAALRNQSTAALLCVRHRGDRYIIAYGTGRHGIDSTALESGFGLRVVANAVGPEMLIGADTRAIGKNGRSSSSRLPSAGPIYELGVEPSEDLIRQLEGKPPSDFADGVSGGDMLRLRIRGFSLRDLPAKLDEISAHYSSDVYKEYYPFLDYFVRVPRENKELCAQLDDELGRLILEPNARVGFLPPEQDEGLLVDYYLITYGRRRKAQLLEIDADSLLGLLEEWKPEDPLREIKIAAFSNGDRRALSTRSLLQYVVADVVQGDSRYTICAGQWYKIDLNHLSGIERRLKEIPETPASQRNLIPWAADIGNEGVYNDRAAEAYGGFKLLDKRNFSFGRYQRIEVCDLLDRDKRLICVKKASGSSTLSHLFAQGYISAGFLVDEDDRRYQDKVLQYLRELDPAATFGERRDWTVTYAIASPKAGRLADSLFFFSKVNLDKARSILVRLGLGLELVRIPYDR